MPNGAWECALRTPLVILFKWPLGAIQDDELLYELGKEVARQVKLSGLHVNFAPVVDVNNNAANPVINFRSFGEDKYNVLNKAIAYMKGMQDHKVFTTAKHFPGHGDTRTDSHWRCRRSTILLKDWIPWNYILSER